MLKNITFSTDDRLIKKARRKAMLEHSSLNSLFRQWLEQYVGKMNEEDYQTLMKELNYVKPGKKFTREEMNER